MQTYRLRTCGYKFIHVLHMWHTYIYTHVQKMYTWNMHAFQGENTHMRYNRFHTNISYTYTTSRQNRTRPHYMYPTRDWLLRRIFASLHIFMIVIGGEPGSSIVYRDCLWRQWRYTLLIVAIASPKTNNTASTIWGHSHNPLAFYYRREEGELSPSRKTKVFHKSRPRSLWLSPSWVTY
jgi:hypothetical protein